ncbi:hypothetical protein Lalb_Chr02g0146911 [Lupinus albus]|uniref:Transmembrane protein n=1 Tax=Lupinus albus TaxID=3870 RepID=A0A6A4QXH5_LUPAL|nr:hypothetical protein Lalb_Chr02g0146911 [Lupinus albus]
MSREKDVEFDLESGGNTSEEDSGNNLCVSEREPKSSAFPWSLNGMLNFDGSDKHQSRVELCSKLIKSDDVMAVGDNDDLELLVDKGLEHVQDQEKISHLSNGDHKGKLNNPRKTPKPPLPPRGPSLDAGDQKYVKELAELALRKRARIKKMKATRKMKAIKSLPSSSSSYANLSAMAITVFFFLVIIFQGIKSANSAAFGVTASPEASDEGLISVQYPKNFTNEGDASGSLYTSSAGKVS